MQCEMRPDVIALLEEDHRIVLGWFGLYRTAEDTDRRQRIAAAICAALRAHMVAEEEIFYPAAAQYISADNLIQRALVEHDTAKQLIEGLEQTGLGDQRHGQLMNRLEQDIRKHITDEENVLMPEVRTSGMDVYEVGAVVAAQRAGDFFVLRE